MLCDTRKRGRGENVDLLPRYQQDEQERRKHCDDDRERRDEESRPKKPSQPRRSQLMRRARQRIATAERGQNQCEACEQFEYMVEVTGGRTGSNESKKRIR